jgi:hypothetical protein
VHDFFGVAAGLSIRQQWVNAFPPALAEKTPHPAGFICLGCSRQTSNSWVFVLREARQQARSQPTPAMQQQVFPSKGE